jgi:adenylate cyclase
VADIFISYARFDKARVSPIVAALEAQGWSVWWDPAIAPGEEFDRLIARELQRARAVVVVWTPVSVESRWVRGEARDGAERGILVPLRFEQATLPIDTRALHTIDLDAWDGTPGSPLLQPVLRAIGSRLGTTTGAPQSPAVAAGPTATHAGASICVLPFANMSGDPEQEYFSDGICEDVITDLSKVSSLFVVARNTSFTYKGRHVDVPQLAQRLNVSHVLEGSVRKAGGRVRINAQLIDGRTGGHAWAERYDRDLSDIFALQDEISEAIVRALKLKLLPAEKQAIENRGTADVAAYDIYLRGRQLIRREKETESRAAAELFRQATRLDPTFAAAYAGLAQILALMIFRRQELSGSMLAEATQASERALDLAPALAEAWVSRAIVHMVARENDAAARAYERAIAIDPRSFDAHYFYARFHVTQGGHARAIEHYEKAFEIDPSNYLPMTLSIQEHHALGDMAGARRAIERSWAAIERRLAMDPDDSAAYDHGAGVLHALGRVDESRQFSERAIALRPDDGATHYNAACCAALAREYPRALDLLERAVELGYGNIEWLLNDNDLVPLHGEPRFQRLVERLEARRFDGRSAASSHGHG